jgi:hypothetical protein
MGRQEAAGVETKEFQNKKQHTEESISFRKDRRNGLR